MTARSCSREDVIGGMGIRDLKAAVYVSTKYRCQSFCQLDGVTGRRPTVVVAVAVPQDDGVGIRSQAGPAPSIMEGRPWSTMRVSTCHWKAPAYALWTQQGESCARPRWPAGQTP